MTPSAVEVLFIEDSEDDIELAVRALGKDGLEVSFQRVDSADGLRRVLAMAQPDVILSDFAMPDFDGIHALKLARELAPQVPFIFLSGTIGEERAIEAIRHGATDYVLKNNMRRLGTAVKRALIEAAERRRIRRAEEERAQLVEMLEATSDYVAVTDAHGRILYMNAAWRRLADVRQNDLSDQRLIEFHPEALRDMFLHDALPASLRQGLWQGEAAVLAADGGEVPVSEVIITHRNAAGEVRFRSTIARDIRDRKAYEARIQYLANYDPLTGLPNRSLLADRAAQAIAPARRVRRHCAVIALNIDRFKLVNEGFGQAAGDALLRLAAQRLQQILAPGDTAARLGADSFAVLASDLAGPESASVLAAKIQGIALMPFELDGREVHFTVSVGVAVFPRDGAGFDVLLRNAEAAMQRVRNSGGDGLQFYAAAMTSEAAERIELGNDLRRAIERGEIELHYQPQIEIAGGRLCGLEALMRWRHPGRGWVPPARFIALAEETDLINVLGEWALGQACRQLAAWDGEGLGVPRIAVNVSARQFRSESFVDAVGEALRRHGVAAARLELELTESLLIEDRDAAIATLDRLKQVGVQVAVDDFGTGYSSLSYLSGLPVDCLKIDRSFVVQADKGGRDATIAQAIISLAHGLDLRVLAEGVETTAQLDFLRAHGCDECQGYLFARPQPAAALAEVLRRGALAPGS
jgi:diguanylate cyclase (GGDEF)-like protein/PAS domain S-box-containing protein